MTADLIARLIGAEDGDVLALVVLLHNRPTPPEPPAPAAAIGTERAFIFDLAAWQAVNREGYGQAA
jgi:hypothetical protein